MLLFNLRPVQTGFSSYKDQRQAYLHKEFIFPQLNMRRFTRLTNSFSKKVDNLKWAVSLHFMYYNFVRVHKTLGETPVMAAGIADHVCKLEEIVALLDVNFFLIEINPLPSFDKEASCNAQCIEFLFRLLQASLNPRRFA